MKVIIHILLLFYIFSFPVNVHAQIVWPIEEQHIQSLSSNYNGNDVYAVVSTREDDAEIPITALSSGIVLSVREAFAVHDLPGIVVLRSVHDVFVTYQNISPNVVLGQSVEVGDYLGNIVGGNELVIKMYDTILNTAMDPLFVLPHVNRDLMIRLLDVQFHYREAIEPMELQRRIKSGLTDVLVSIKITDNDSKWYILPYLVVLDIDGNVYEKTTDEILGNRAITPLKPEGVIDIVFQDIELRRGYFDIKIGIHTLQEQRVFRFNVFAY